MPVNISNQPINIQLFLELILNTMIGKIKKVGADIWSHHQMRNEVEKPPMRDLQIQNGDSHPTARMMADILLCSIALLLITHHNIHDAIALLD